VSQGEIVSFKELRPSAADQKRPGSSVGRAED
jgi:hypothetical protein